MGLLKNRIVCSIYGALVCSVGIAQANVVVESRDEQWENTSQTLLRVRIFNDSQDTLKNIELHYFLSPRECPIILDKYHPQNLDARIDTSSSKISILKISLPELPPGIFPDSGGLALGLHFSDWSSFGKSSDFSAPRSEDYHATGKIAVYAEGTFLCGFLPGTLPNASPISLDSGSEVSIGPGEHVHFAWREVDNASSYRLNVLSASDSTIVLQTVTDKNRVDAELETGEYLWNVESSEYGSESAFWDGNLFQTDTPYKLTVLADTTYFILKALDVPPLSARKDTRLLDLKWGEMALAREWDKPHLNHEHYDEEEHSRCWAVSAQMLNRYYGGNLTQDEIKIKFKGYPGVSVFSDSIRAKLLGTFLHYYQGGMFAESFESILDWVFGGNATLHRTDTAPSESEITEWINRGIPLYVWTQGHAMIIDAYRYSLSKRLDIRLLNTDNDGTVEWRSLRSTEIKGFIAAEVSGIVRNSDERIHTDSDGDGLMDFDEIERFGTDPDNPDSDGDGIDDKTEIFSYTIRDTIVDKDSTSWKIGLSKLTFADIDGDGLRAEMDFDSDGGGISDGSEDINKNGILEIGETDVYDADDDESSSAESVNVPGNMTLYALGTIAVNDGVKCHAGKKFRCDIASESGDSAYAVNIGRGAEVRRIESKGGIFLRDYARVTGNIKIYSLPEKNWTLTTQNNVKFTRASFSTLKSLWPYRIAELSTMPPAGDSIADVAYGKSLTLKNGDRIKTLKVHPGGTLFIAPGEMHAENIQLESGSKVQFISPGQRTVLHLNGSVIWRARNQNEDMEQVAKGFMLVQHGSETMTVEGMWAGTIFAPNANLILGQSNKKLYGRFLGKDITVHQYATVYSVNFKPEITTKFVWRKK